MDVDVIVVGKGLVGSAVAKHLSTSVKVAIIGPDEPSDSSRASVFGSHYDSGRVQRRLGRNDTMTRLNLLSTGAYGPLEDATGIRFHAPVGTLYVYPEGENRYLAEAPARASRFDIDVRTFSSGEEIGNAFPEFHFPPSSQGLFEPAPSGHINPRALLQAQLQVVSRNGGSIVREVVERVEQRGHHAVVTTKDGAILEAPSVVLAGGAFTSVTNIYHRRPKLTLKSETVILARVHPTEAERLTGLPSVLYDIDVPELEGIYLTPPLAYPDGHMYVKMGCNLPQDIFFGGELLEIQQWFRHGDSDAHIELMGDALARLMPRLSVEEIVSKRCILTRTMAHENPYIDQLDERVSVAIGNGWSAMCSDGIGHVTSHLVRHGRFPDGFSAEDHAVVCEEGPETS